MSFTYPLGLLGLIGIPIVIIIYILKSKYTEQTVSSTYLWHLSDKFLKKRNPFSGLSGVISLILQILTIAAISLAIAHPVLIIPNGANDYYFILDASGSMNMQSGEHTRFEKAKDEILEIIDESVGGSSYTLITVSDEAVTVFEGVTKKATASEFVENVKSSYLYSENSELLSTTQTCFDENPSAFIYVLTDKKYEPCENVQLIDLSVEGEENYALFNSSYSHSGGKLSVTASVISYESDASLGVALFVDGASAPVKRETVEVKSGEYKEVTLACAVTQFSSFRIEIENADIYSYDNGITTHNLKTDKTYSTLIVSESGFFLHAAIDAILDSEVTIVDPDDYANVTESYGLYIFDSCTPDELPDGNVWLINCDKNIENSGFSIRGRNELGAPDTIEKSTSTATAVRALLEGVDGSGISISNYVKYSSMYLKFSTLFTYGSNPLIFAGTNGLGNRQVVFGFSLNESDIALSSDFVILLRNLLEYSFPDVISETNYTVGESALVNVVANAGNIKAISPSGKEVYMESDGSFASVELEEIGSYTIKMTISGVENTYNVYSGAHPDESVPNVYGNEFSVSGEKKHEMRDGEYDLMTILFICIAVLFIADWGVYCYEKYQLR